MTYSYGYEKLDNGRYRQHRFSAGLHKSLCSMPVAELEHAQDPEQHALLPVTQFATVESCSSCQERLTALGV